MAVKFKGKSIDFIVQSLRADEWISNYQYHIGKEISQGKAKNFLDKIFDENGDEEYNDHFKSLSDWLQAMGYPLETSFVRMNEIANTPFVDVKDPSTTEDLFDIAWKGENEAIEAYRAALKEDAVADYPELAYMFMEFLKDELHHAKELADVGSQIKGGKVDLDVGKNVEGDSDDGADGDDENSDDDNDGENGGTETADGSEDGENAENDDGAEGKEEKKDNDEDGEGDGDGEDDNQEEKAEESTRDENRPNAQFIPLENHIGGENDETKKVSAKKKVNEAEVITEKKTHKKMGVLEKIMMKGMD